MSAIRRFFNRVGSGPSGHRAKASVLSQHCGRRFPLARWGRRAKRRCRAGLRPLAIFYPRTIAQSVGLGLFVIIAPLVAALALAVTYVDTATVESQRAVQFSSEGIRHSLLLSDLVKDMERSVRVYHIMEQESLLTTYEQLRSDFIATANRLYQLEINPSLKPTIIFLLDREQELHQAISSLPAGSAEAGAAIDRFAELSQAAAALVQQSSIAVEDKVRTMKLAAASARQALTIEAAIAIALAALIGSAVIPRLLKYTRELDRSIHQLGAGDLQQPIMLTGPQDIRALGRRLEWLREQLQLLEEQRRQFLQHFSHELKTPLSSIREGSCLLADGVAGPLHQEQQDILDILQRNCANLQEHIENLLTFSENMHPFQTLNREDIQLDEEILAVTREHHLQIRAKDLQVETRLEPIVAWLDAAKFRTVIDNLISNAVKHSPRGGILRLLTYQSPTGVIIEVADEGPGIPPSIRHRVFDAFFKAEDPQQSNIHGSGIGLSIAKLYVKAHGGDIEVADSEQGATFRLSLPLKTLAP